MRQKHVIESQYSAFMSLRSLALRILNQDFVLNLAAANCAMRALKPSSKPLTHVPL